MNFTTERTYRDGNNVLRCAHHRKLHIVCDECRAAEQEKIDEVRQLAWFIGIAVAALVGVMVALAYVLYIGR
jgi:hypothetical protein